MQTSIINRNQAYISQIENLSLRRKTVFNLVKVYGFISAHQIAKKMKLGINCVSGRITELQNMFLITEAGSVYNEKTKTSNTLWKTTNKDERINLINKEYQVLTDKRDKLINDFNLGLSDVALGVIKKEVATINKKIKNLEKYI